MDFSRGSTNTNIRCNWKYDEYEMESRLSIIYSETPLHFWTIHIIKNASRVQRLRFPLWIAFKCTSVDVQIHSENSHIIYAKWKNNKKNFCFERDILSRAISWYDFTHAKCTRRSRASSSKKSRRRVVTLSTYKININEYFFFFVIHFNFEIFAQVYSSSVPCFV